MNVTIMTENGWVDTDEQTSFNIEWTNPFITKENAGAVYTYDMSLPITDRNIEIFEFDSELYKPGVGSSWNCWISLGIKNISGRLFIDSIDLKDQRIECIIVLEYADILKMNLRSILTGYEEVWLQLLEKMEIKEFTDGISFVNYESDGISRASANILDNTLNMMPCTSLRAILKGISTQLGYDIRINDIPMDNFSGDTRLDPSNYAIKAGEIAVETGANINFFGFNPIVFMRNATTHSVADRREITITTTDPSGNAHVETGRTTQDFPMLYAYTGFKLTISSVKGFYMGDTITNKSLDVYVLEADRDIKVSIPPSTLEDATYVGCTRKRIGSVIGANLYALNQGRFGNVYGFDGVIEQGVSWFPMDRQLALPVGRVKYLTDRYVYGVNAKVIDDDNTWTRSGSIIHLRDVVPDIELSKLLDDWTTIIGGGYEVLLNESGVWTINIKTCEYSLDGSFFGHLDITNRSTLARRYPLDAQYNDIVAADYEDYEPSAFKRIYPVPDESLELNGEYKTLTLGAGGTTGSNYDLLVKDIEAERDDNGNITKYKSSKKNYIWCYQEVGLGAVKNIWYLDRVLGLSNVMHMFIMNANELEVDIMCSYDDFCKMRYSGYRIFNIDGRDWILENVTQDGENATLTLLSFDIGNYKD